VDPAARPVDVLTVVAVTDVTPTVRRVLLRGTPEAAAAAGPTVHLLVPRVADADPQWPEIARDGRIVWPQGSHGVSLRSYTARRQDPQAGTVEIDFVLHGTGPAAAWAAAAEQGAPVAGVAEPDLQERVGHGLARAVEHAALEARRPLGARPLVKAEREERADGLGWSRHSNGVERRTMSKR
jgi:NADPH-dependent ferric siderophore reductase